MLGAMMNDKGICMVNNRASGCWACTRNDPNPQWGGARVLDSHHFCYPWWKNYPTVANLWNDSSDRMSHLWSDRILCDHPQPAI